MVVVVVVVFTVIDEALDDNQKLVNQSVSHIDSWKVMSSIYEASRVT